jgi:hypothetical protein
VAFLRSSLFALLVCLFVLTGYSAQAFELCCARTGREQTQQTKASAMQSIPDDAHDCQCPCHQVLVDPISKPLQVIGASIVSVESLISGNQFPPDALPLGIEYPPQLS